MRIKKILSDITIMFGFVLMAISAIAGIYDVEAADIVYSGTSGDLNWTIDSEGCLTLSGSGDYKWDPVLISYSDSVKTAVVNVKNITRMDNLFEYYSNLKEVDFTGSDTSQVINMHGLFSGCSNLESVRFGNFDTSNVKDMGSMFSGCRRLAELDVSGFDTSKVEDMSYMFWNCGKIKQLDVSGFDTSEVKNMSNMFYNCRELIELNVSRFDTSKVEDMTSMFFYCCSLNELDVSDFDISKAWSVQDMFHGCSSLTRLDVSGFDLSNVAIFGMFESCESLKRISIKTPSISSVDNYMASMSNMFLSCHNLVEVDMSGFDASYVTYMNYMLADCPSLRKIYTPLNVKIEYELVTDFDTQVQWQDESGRIYTKLPMNLNKSIVLTRVESAQKGDINGDGDIALNDLMMCLYHVSGRSALTGGGFQAADIDGNGKVELTDLMRILYFVSGRNSTL